MFTESLTPRPELENSLGHFLPHAPAAKAASHFADGRGEPRVGSGPARLDVGTATEVIGNKTVLMTRVEIGLEQLLNQFAKGERHARRDLMEYADKLDIDFLAEHKQTLEQALTPNYQAILEASLARRTGAGNVAPATRVVASSELLDDDAAEPEPSAPSPPKAKIEPELEPPQIPGQKPFSQMGWTERRAWYPDWPAQKERLLQERAKAAAKANKQ
jgi:hypothetical protein